MHVSHVCCIRYPVNLVNPVNEVNHTRQKKKKKPHTQRHVAEALHL